MIEFTPEEEERINKAIQLSSEHIAQFFRYAHLQSQELRSISRMFAHLATHVLELPHNPERTVALRKLLESKDAAVRAQIAKAPALTDE